LPATVLHRSRLPGNFDPGTFQDGNQGHFDPRVGTGEELDVGFDGFKAFADHDDAVFAGA
jgi:hypothetical protein